MRHYYDVYGLLQRPEVRAFIGTDAYKAHKAKRFRRGDNPNIAQNDAFVLSDAETRKAYEKAYEDTSALYYGDRPSFERDSRGDRDLGRPAVADCGNCI